LRETSVQNNNNVEANEEPIFELSGILFYYSEMNQMCLDVETFRGPWQFDADTTAVRVRCQVIEVLPDKR
jgi:hypothetical protein